MAQLSCYYSILVCIFIQFFRVLDLVKALHKLICKVRDPIIKLLTHLYKYTSYFSFPRRNKS